MSTQRVQSLSVAAAVSLLLAAPGSVRAQQETEAAEGEVASGAIDTIVVTARRREESIQDVPVAVSAFGAADLREMQARTLDNLQGAVPNANIVQGRGSASSVNVFIRGVGQPDALQTFDPGVGIYVDDVYMSRIQGALFSMFDVERIEVLRGPQGTLYGKNTAGGAIRIITRQPEQELRGDVEISAGNYGRLETKVFASGGLSENVTASIAGLYADSDGYVKDPDTGREYNDDGNQAVRAKLVAHATDDITLTFGADYTRQRNELTLGNPEAPLTQFDFVLGAVVLRPAVDGNYKFRSRTSFDGGEDQELDHWGLSAVLDWSLSDAWDLKSITAYRDLETSFYIDIDASEFQLGDVLVELDQNQLSQELQFHYDAGGDKRGILGLFYMNEDVPSHQEAYADDFLALAGAPLSFLRTIDDDLENRSYAAFAHGTWEFAQDWSLGAGLRYTYEQKDYDRTTSTFSDFPALNGTFAFSDSESWDAWTPSLTLQKTFHTGFMGYGSASRGFKSGGFNGRANAPGDVSTFDPEYVWTYELGIKTNSVDGRKFGNFVVFHSDYEDFQARVAEVVDPNAPIPNFSFPVINAGELRIRGAEFEGGLLLGEATRLSTQIGYQDAEYREFDDDSFPGGDRSGEQVPFSPRWTARVAAAHTLHFSGGDSFTLGGDVSYRGEAWLSVDNREVLKQDSFTLIGVYGTYDTANERWQVRAGVRNLSDRLYKTDAQEFSSVGNIQTAYYGWPRQYYAAVRYSF
jgi:iron complex outermembrane recepter protein